MKMDLHHREKLLLCLALAEILADSLRREAKDLIYHGTEFFCYLSHDLVSAQWKTPPSAKSGSVSKQPNTCTKEKMGKKHLKCHFSFHL